jgi:hypothetical protein
VAGSAVISTTRIESRGSSPLSIAARLADMMPLPTSSTSIVSREAHDDAAVMDAWPPRDASVDSLNMA